MKNVTFALLLLFLPAAAHGALTSAQLESAGVNLPPNARLPLTLIAPDLTGRRISLSDALAGKSGFVLFVDYTCKTLCGPALVLLTSALSTSSIPRDAWHLIVIGLDPKDSAADARRMMLAQVPEKLRARSIFLLPDNRMIAAATTALGFHYVYDKSVDQFAHPEVVYAVANDGRILRLLSPLTLTAGDINTALSEVPAPSQSLYASVRVLCYRFGLLTGIYDAPVELALRVAGIFTVLLMVGGMFLMFRQKRLRT